MPRNSNLKKVMVIGSGPIVIGQAAEFDYAGTQACRALKAEGLEVVLVNSNPATIMTDHQMADQIYIEPLTLTTLERIIEKERPDGLLATLGGQTGLTLAMQLAKKGVLRHWGVDLLGVCPEAIDKAEDRQLFKDTMEEINQPVIPSKVVTTLADALAFGNEVGYPVIVRPAFTLGGSGGGIAHDEVVLKEIAANGLRQSPIHQILVEQCIAGWKEIEFEVMRDGAGNVITVCSMENFDAVGVHTGDSIVVAPTLTLADKEYQMLRTAALNIITALGIQGGCNCQFALNPDSFEYAVIEVNPRVSRSSALASKATGYPIAKVAALIAVGYHLDEILNQVTGRTYACFEPALDYVVVKFPKWPFDKFVYAKRTLGTQMKATGEVMAIGQSFEEALMKAVRGAELGMETLRWASLSTLTDEAILERLNVCDDRRLFVIFEALHRQISVEAIHEATQVDPWFLHRLARMAAYEKAAQAESINQTTYLQGKKMGYLDKSLLQWAGGQEIQPALAGYKMVDTCAAEFAAETPYFYSSYDDHNEAAQYLATHGTDKKRVVVLGSGPIRIGQGIEFDYASVHCVWTLQKAGYEVAIINNNPETVSTDFDTADRLYFEPLTPEDVLHVLATEKPVGVVAAFGGQTAIKLTQTLEKSGVPILGTSADSIDLAEDRGRFEALLESLNLARPQGGTVTTLKEALDSAHSLGYPVLLRPSYVLGGQNMIIAFNDEDVEEYMSIILSQTQDKGILIDKYMMGTEIEVDAICDGTSILIPGIMEHIERAGVHSGDSIAVYPAWNVNADLIQRIVECTSKLALALKTRGLVNIQYVIYGNEIYVIEVNPRSSRTVPYLSKVTGVPMVELATRAMLGEKLEDMGYGTGLAPKMPYVAVKVPVFSFEKLADVDVLLGPEMKSTGEVLGIGKSLEEALYKGLAAAGYTMKKQGGVFFSVRQSDHGEIAPVAKTFYEQGFVLYATEGTAKAIAQEGMEVQLVKKIHEGEGHVLDLLESGKVDYVISTSTKGRIPTRDSVKIRRKAVERSIPCLTSLDTAQALANSLKSRYSLASLELVDINRMRRQRKKLPFIKMQGCGNDNIIFNCLQEDLIAPESLSIYLSDRHYGIGGEGLVQILPSDQADARMRMFNLDGSEGGMAGNALRCVAKYLYDEGIVKKESMEIETMGGIRQVELFCLDGKAETIKINMGVPLFEPRQIPARLSGDSVIDYPLTVLGQSYKVTCLSLGNPHCVVFVSNLEELELEKLGPAFESHEAFPERINTTFARILDPFTLAMRVWERGSGETWSCGTGACAAVVAAVKKGLCPQDRDIIVKLKGGRLVIRYAKTGEVFLTGGAIVLFEGAVEI